MSRVSWLLHCIATALAAATLVASDPDLRVADAAKRDDKETIRTLLQNGANVNQAHPDGTTALGWAAYHDNTDIAALLIRAGANVNAPNDYGVTPLSLACDNASAAMVALLVNAKADPNVALATGETPLMTCARRGSAAAVEHLLSHGANVNAFEKRHGQTALMWAVAQKHHEIARVLIEHGADVHARTTRIRPWQFATYLGGVQDVAQGDYTPVLFAVRQGDLESVKLLLGAGASLNEVAADGMTPLLLAAASGHEQLAIYLVDKGADVHRADPNGVTPLHYAVQRGLAIVGMGGGGGPAAQAGSQPNMRELVKTLLAHGADPNARLANPPARMRLVAAPRIEPAGTTPFLLAAASNDMPLMRTLLAAGADPNLTTTDNTTALMLAAGIAGGQRATKEQEKNVLETVRLLVELGNDVNAVSTNDDRMINGRTAMHGATYLGMDSVIQFLAEKGANVGAADRCGETPLNIALGDPAQRRFFTERIRGGYKSTAELLRRLGGDVAVATPEVDCSLLANVHARFSSQKKELTNAKPEPKE